MPKPTPKPTPKPLTYTVKVNVGKNPKQAGVVIKDQTSNKLLLRLLPRKIKSSRVITKTLKMTAGNQYLVEMIATKKKGWGKGTYVNFSAKKKGKRGKRVWAQNISGEFKGKKKKTIFKLPR